MNLRHKIAFFFWICFASASSILFAEDIKPQENVAPNGEQQGSPSDKADQKESPPKRKKTPLRLEIKEVPLGQVEIEGNIYYKTTFLRRHFGPVLEAPFLHQNELEQRLRLINEFPDLRVNAILMPGKDLSRTDLLLKVNDKRPVHLTLEYNNFGARVLGDARLTTTLTWGDLTGHGDRVLLRAATIPNAIVEFPLLQINYMLPVGLSGTKVHFSYARSRFAVGDDFILLDIDGKSSIYDIMVTHPWARLTNRSIDMMHSVSAKREMISDIDQVTFDNKIQSISLGVNWSEQWSPRHRLVTAGTLTQGFGKNLGVRYQAAKINFNMKDDLVLNSRFSLQSKVAGQLSNTSLLLSDQFTIGGIDSVRGFTQGEGVGDNGATTGMELRLSLDQQGRFATVGFIDHGSAFLRNAQPGQRSHTALTGMGIGLRAAFLPYLFGRIDLGIPVSPSKNADHKGIVAYAQVACEF
ncbi:MAG: ShlB/FhaC/HecB family hemolysin secretion/activation protein [Nitrospirota bacterium]